MMIYIIHIQHIYAHYWTFRKKKGFIRESNYLYGLVLFSEGKTKNIILCDWVSEEYGWWEDAR